MKSINTKLFSVICIVILVMTTLCGCSSGGDSGADPDEPVATNGDIRKLMVSHTLVVGVTDFEPLDYMLDDGTWTGFDAELACAFGDFLGVNVQFVEIDWDKKVELLDNGKIDCIWNGMTKTDELDRSISLSSPYLYNSQVVVMKSDQFAKYDSIDKCNHLLFAVESGSAGKSLAQDYNYRTIFCDTQKDALISVSEGRCDAAIIDNLMAASMTGEGSEFSNLSYDYPLSSEEFVVGFRKTSPLTNEVNAFFNEYFGTDSAKKLGDKYNLIDAMVHPYN
ncbi:MAG: transporter substrate-binding domain-containing protein [Lachnospiraceae bacterium]|nr:transporter substrate-binding domain-containing protein [Lachnospiraceae bacterium]